MASDSPSDDEGTSDEEIEEIKDMKVSKCLLKFKK
jgi:hypothetical protein